MTISFSLDNSEILTPSTLSAVGDDRQADVHRGVVVARAPVAGKRGIEHLAEPVDDHRLLHLAEDTVVDAGVVVGAARGFGEGPARHQDDAPAEGFDRGDLLLVGGDDIVDGRAGAGHELVGAGAGGNQRAGRALARHRPSGGSARAPRASPGPCRAARCPWPRRRRGRGPRDDARKATVRSQSIAASSQGSLSASGSATTWAAE